MPFLTASARDTYFRVWNAPNPAAAVILVHGFGEHSGMYHRLAWALVAQGIEVWGVDLPGHGLSAGPRGILGSVDHASDPVAEVVARLRAKLPGIPLTLVGSSLGAIVGGIVVGRDPGGYRSLLMSGPPIDPAILLATMADLSEFVTSEDPHYLDQLRFDPAAFDVEPLLPAMANTITAAVPELNVTLPRLEQPVRFMSGALDPFCTPEVGRRWVARLQQGSQLVIEGGHHDVMNDLQHVEVERAVAAFVLGSGDPREP